MKNIRVVDANVILRYLLQDHEAHFAEARRFFDGVKNGSERVHVPQGVLVETVYVLLKVYGVPKRQIADTLGEMLCYRGIVNEDAAELRRALELFAGRNVDVVDALVHVTAKANGWQVFSFDRDLEKLEQ